MDKLLEHCKNVIEFSLLVEIKVLKDNHMDIDAWPDVETKSYDVNHKLCSRDFNNKVEILAVLMNLTKKETMNYLKRKAKELYKNE